MTAPAKYRKKPVTVEAMRLDGSEEGAQRILAWVAPQNLGTAFAVPEKDTDRWTVVIETLEGAMAATPGDWIIRGVQGEFYPCKPDIFEQTYEGVPEVMELGEDDGEQWIVTGTQDDEGALDAVLDWLKSTDPTGASADPDYVEAIRGGSVTHRDDWYWHPVIDTDPDGDAELRSVQRDGARAECDSEVFCARLVVIA